MTLISLSYAAGSTIPCLGILQHFLVRQLPSLFLVRQLPALFLVRQLPALFLVRQLPSLFLVRQLPSLFLVRQGIVLVALFLVCGSFSTSIYVHFWTFSALFVLCGCCLHLPSQHSLFFVVVVPLSFSLVTL